MVVNEKALLRAMKEAYRGKGYHVAAFYAEGSDQVVIMADRWTVTMERKNVPGKIRGFIAETAGDWPELDEGYRVRKNMPEFEEISMVLGVLNDIRDSFTGDSVEQVKPADLLLGIDEIRQGCTICKMVLMDSGLTEIIGSSRIPVIRSGPNIREMGKNKNVPAIDLLYDFEVIGNIHDNPELLGGGQDA